MKKYLLLTMLPLSLLHSCCKNDDSSDVEITFNSHEEVVENNKYYFSCYINGEFWHSRPPRPEDKEAFSWETVMEFDNTPTHVGDGNYGLLKVLAKRYPDKKLKSDDSFNDALQAIGFTFTTNNPKRCGVFAKHIDTIPFFASETNSPVCVASFDENHQCMSFNFYLDSAQSYDLVNGKLVPSSTGWNDVIWGRFNGTFSNDSGEIIQVTDGKFKLLEGTWSSLY